MSKDAKYLNEIKINLEYAVKSGVIGNGWKQSIEFLIEKAEENEQLHKALDGLGKAVEIYSEMPLEKAMQELIELIEEDKNER